MDCLCCEKGGEGPPSETEFLGSICQTQGDAVGSAKFPAETDRYTLYVSPGCPFAARPWAVLAFYGLDEGERVRVVKCFPASDQEGWFFEAQSIGERRLVQLVPDALYDREPHHGCHHLRQLYEMARPGFQGTISVPLLWDSKGDTAVSNSSLGLAEMMAAQMKHLGTRNVGIDLFPLDCSSEAYKEHRELVQWIHKNITIGPYQVVAAATGPEQTERRDKYYAAMDEIQERLQGSGGPYLMGADICFADLLLWISLVRLDLAYQWRFGLGRRNVRENYPLLWTFVQRIMALPGMASTILPRELMAQYFLSTKWVESAGQILPGVPESWANVCLPN